MYQTVTLHPHYHSFYPLKWFPGWQPALSICSEGWVSMSFTNIIAQARKLWWVFGVHSVCPRHPYLEFIPQLCKSSQDNVISQSVTLFVIVLLLFIFIVVIWILLWTWRVYKYSKLEQIDSYSYNTYTTRKDSNCFHERGLRLLYLISSNILISYLESIQQANIIFEQEESVVRSVVPAMEG